MNVFEEYEAELIAKARAEIEAEDAKWRALTRDQQYASMQEVRKKQITEMQRQRRIARHHADMFGPDDPEDADE